MKIKHTFGVGFGIKLSLESVTRIFGVNGCMVDVVAVLADGRSVWLDSRQLAMISS